MKFRLADTSSSEMISSKPLNSTCLENGAPKNFSLRRVKETCKEVDEFPCVLPVKRKHKLEMIIYPEKILLPDKSLIRALYVSAVGEDDSHQNQLDEDRCGVLCMEGVLLPACAREETTNLKIMQAKAQRDSPDDVNCLKYCRRAVYESIENGIVVARAARLKRESEERERRRRIKHERKISRKQRRKENRLKVKEEIKRLRLERAEHRKSQKERKREEMKKQLPKNMKLWQEVAFLMTELAKVKKEERMWLEVQRQLVARSEEISREVSVEVRAKIPETDENPSDYKIRHKEFQARVENAVQDINLSFVRIKRTAEVVKKTVCGADLVRTRLYEKYTRDHQFHGYAGVSEPKSLIRILSQD